MSGNVISKGYKEQAEVLMEKFPELDINILEKYYLFKDSEMFRILLSSNVGDNTDVTKEIQDSLLYGAE